MNSRAERDRSIQRDIGRILLHEWDPIGVEDVPEAQDEYDSYIGPVHRLLVGGASAFQVAEYLATIEAQMSFTTPPTSVMGVAERLIQLGLNASSD